MTKPEIKTQLVDYHQDGVALQGYMAYDPAVTTPRPGVLIAHEWYGLNEYTQRRAREVAELGYVAFALDMYGKGKVADNTTDAKKLMDEVAPDAELIRLRGSAALEVLRRQPQCDAKQVAAIGYCFGGMVALELARAGCDLAAVVSFHGILSSPSSKPNAPVRAKILICTGADDAWVTSKQVDKFVEEMRESKVDFQIISYGKTVHSFTNPDADKRNMDNLRYNFLSDKRSFAAMAALLDETFGALPG